jgi:hypothetical protein
MSAVTIPAGLRERLITQAAAKQGALLRRKLYRIGTASAAALVLLALVFGVFSNTRTEVNTDWMVLWAEKLALSPEDATRAWLEEQKLPNELPDQQQLNLLDYGFLAGLGTEEIQGKSVPVITFKNDTGFAKVYIFRNTGSLDTRGVRDVQSSRASALVVHGQGRFRDVTYVCVFTGHDLKPFLRTRNGILPV